MRVGFTRSHGERITPAHWLGRALQRRGIAVLEIDGPEDEVDAVLIGAPEARMGPERVRAWRAFAERGGHVLAISPDDAPDADCGLFLPGLETVGGRVQPRGPSKLEPPDGPVAGSLRPKGRRWFGFSHTYDVLHAWPVDAGWSFVQLALGEGTVGLVAGESALDGDPETALRSSLLNAWLPALHRHVLEARPRAILDHGHGARWPDGIAVDEVLVPGGPVAAVRALLDAGLIERQGDRLRLTELGRTEERLVATLWELEQVLVRVDAAG